MPSLSELQQRFAAALLAGADRPGADGPGAALPGEWFAGVLPLEVSLRVHRNTTLGALSNALRLSYPAVERAVGAEYFDSLAVAYARLDTPGRPQLDVWGEGFVAHLASQPPLASMPWLADLAQLDWTLERLGQVAAIPMQWLAPTGSWQLAASLRVIDVNFAVDELREAVMSEAVDAVRALIAAPSPRCYALWRAEEGVRLRPLSRACADWLRAALAGAPSLRTSPACPPPPPVLQELQSATFARSAAARV